MSIEDLFIPEVMETSSDCLFKDFFSPVLKHSVRYDCGVGFFTSGWIEATAQCIVPFVEHGGVARAGGPPALNSSPRKSLGATAL